MNNNIGKMKNIFEQIFNEQKERINKNISFVFNNKYSNFYKEKYSGLPEINSYTDFQKIPFLEKREMLSAGLKNFTFTSDGKIIRYMFSSGTTGKPLTTAHNAPSPKIPGRKEAFEKIKLSKALFLFPINIQNDRLPTLTSCIPAIPGDIYNIPLMANLLKTSDINGISSTPTILEFFTKELKKGNDFDFNKIKWVELAGEFTTSQRMESLKRIFPMAYFDHIWGATETGGHKGYRCKYIKNEPSNVFHMFNDHHMMEVVDENNNAVEENTLGEIIHTDLYKKTTTLIRYKTGDLGKIRKINCKCGNKYVVELYGRANHDRLKIQGITLTSQAIENSLDDIKKYINPGFKMHVYEKNTNNGLIPLLKLELILKNKNYAKKPLFKEMIISKVSKKLFLSSKNNLYNLSARGIFMPLAIDFIDEWPQEVKKKNIVPHLKI